MVPNQQHNPVVIGCDPGTDSTSTCYIAYASTARPYYIITSNANTFNSWGDNPSLWDIEPKFSSRLTHVFAKFLSDAEKAYLRKINFQPTRDGINVCCTWHDRSTHWISSMPQLQARFDRRIPCWRAGRWKSLT